MTLAGDPLDAAAISVQNAMFYQQMQQAHMQAALRFAEEADGADDDFGTR